MLEVGNGDIDIIERSQKQPDPRVSMRVEEFEVAWQRCLVEVTLDRSVKPVWNSGAKKGGKAARWQSRLLFRFDRQGAPLTASTAGQSKEAPLCGRRCRPDECAVGRTVQSFIQGDDAKGED